MKLGRPTYVFILQRQIVYCCSFKYANRKLCFNAVFGKLAEFLYSNEVVLELFKKKCLPMLLYSTEACPLKKSHIAHYNIASFQFVVNSCFAKIFNTRSKDVINDCQLHFQNGNKNFRIKMKALRIYRYRPIICSVVRSRPMIIIIF